MVMGLLGNGGNGAGHADPVGTHGDPDQLPVRPGAVQIEDIRLLSQLEHVAQLDTPSDPQFFPAAGATIARTDLDRADLANGHEVLTPNQVDGAAPALVGPGHPRRAFHHHRVHRIPDAQRAQDLRADVAGNQAGVSGEVIRTGRFHRGGLELGRHPTRVDLTVAQESDDQQAPVALPRAGKGATASVSCPDRDNMLFYCFT